MEHELISVIVPVYNAEKYIQRCIDSIVCQTYKNIEIILVDDGSPDGCGTICDRNARIDSRIHVIHKKNGGLSDARNSGVEKAHGRFITFIDSDDYIAPNYIEYLYELIEKHNADVSSCCMLNTSSDTAEYCVNTHIQDEQVLTGKETCRRLLDDLYIILVTACGKLYKKEIVREYPFPVGKNHEDEATTCKFYYSSQMVVVGNKCLYAYYLNEESITHTKGTKLNQDVIWAMTHRANFFEQKSEQLLAQLSWEKLFNYYVNDSFNYNYRCDEMIKSFKKNKTLSHKTKFEIALYNTSHLLYKLYIGLKNKRRGIINVIFFFKKS